VQGCYVGWSVSCDIKSCVVRVFFYFLLRIKKSYILSFFLSLLPTNSLLFLLEILSLSRLSRAKEK
jgi:hypothetical protein